MTIWAQQCQHNISMAISAQPSQCTSVFKIPLWQFQHNNLSTTSVWQSQHNHVNTTSVRQSQHNNLSTPVPVQYHYDNLSTTKSTQHQHDNLSTTWVWQSQHNHVSTPVSLQYHYDNLSICRTFLYGGRFLLPQKISSNIMCMSAVILVKFCPPAKSVSSRWASINQLWTSIHIQFNNFFAILQCMSWKPGEWTVESTVALRNIRKILEIASAHNWKKITRNFVPRTDEVTGVAVWDCYRAEIVITLLRMLQLKHAIWARGTAVWNCNPCWSCRAEINCCSEIVIHPNVCLSQIKP